MEINITVAIWSPVILALLESADWEAQAMTVKEPE
jgi:hypothetical protein